MPESKRCSWWVTVGGRAIAPLVSQCDRVCCVHRLGIPRVGCAAPEGLVAHFVKQDFEFTVSVGVGDGIYGFGASLAESCGYVVTKVFVDNAEVLEGLGEGAGGHGRVTESGWRVITTFMLTLFP